MTRHVAVYCRLSPRPDGRSEGVDVQERQGREYAAQAWPGLPVVVYADRLLSAADDTWRPEYEKLRQAISDGQVGRLWCVEQSRLQRREVGWFELAAELVAAGIEEVHTNRDGIVRVADEISGIKAVLAASEVRKLTKRINDRLDDNAGQGRPPGSKPFGYEHALTERGEKTYLVVPEQAEAIRWAAGRVLAGWSLSAVAEALRGRGLHGPHRVKVRDEAGRVLLSDGCWADSSDSDAIKRQAVTRPSTLTASSVRGWLTAPSVAGRRVHRGVDVGRGNWEPILDEATWRAVCARLAGSRTVARTDGGVRSVPAAHSGYTGRRYLLTGGLIRCGAPLRDDAGEPVTDDEGKPVICGVPMIASLKQLGKKPGQPPKRVVPYYLCHPSRGGKACTGIMAEATEQHVADRLFAELDKPEFLDLIASDDHAGRREQITRELAEIDGKRRDLARLWGTGELTGEEWQAARDGVAQTERDLRAELTAIPPPPGRVSIEQARQSWPSMTLHERREFIRLFIAKVTISRARPGLREFDSGRVKITWK